MAGLEEFALALILELVTAAIQEGVQYAGVNYFQRRRIELRAEEATTKVVEPLLPFLADEGVSEEKQRRLIETCIRELEPLTEQPGLLFQGSLNGQRIFENLYAERDLPQVIIEDDLRDTYSLLCPRIATILCRIPAAVKDWESEAWSETFSRFDEITSQLRALFSKVDALATQPAREADQTLTMARRTLAQKLGFELDLTGLRADQPLAGKFDDFFVHPTISEQKEEDERTEPLKLRGPDDAFAYSTTRHRRMVLVAAPGAGKSTWSKWLQREILKPERDGIGIRVELRRFSTESLVHPQTTFSGMWYNRGHANTSLYPRPNGSRATDSRSRLAQQGSLPATALPDPCGQCPKGAGTGHRPHAGL